MPKKLPKGISSFEELITENYYYVDKTQYIEKLENLADKRIMLLRPRKFGKSLFLNTLNCYYDIFKKDKFEELFKNTYIGKNPTSLRNSYYILKFDFSGIDSQSDNIMLRFKNSTIESIQRFVDKYNLDFYINEEKEAEEILNSLFTAFRSQKTDGKIYVMIDEYDHFANELLGFHTEDFKDLVSKNGKIRKWYEILKAETQESVNRIFITGVAPITLDSMTSGFNIVKDLTRDFESNEIFGFTEEELVKMMKDQELDQKTINELLPIMKENYDGYRFSIRSDKNVYNSNMCLNFLDDYIRCGSMPDSMVDVNIASDYKKLESMLSLCKGEERDKIIEDSLTGTITSEITEKFNPAKEFDKTDLVSMLFYLGYLTIVGDFSDYSILSVPNKVIKELYSEYFLSVLKDKTDINTIPENADIAYEMLVEGKIDKAIGLMEEYLNSLSNRDYINFDEKYIKLIFYCILMNIKSYNIKSEMEVKRKYPDLLLIPKELDKGYYSIMIEFKYLKKDEEKKLEEKQKEAEDQINAYYNDLNLRDEGHLKKYTVVAVDDKIYFKEV